MKKNTDTIPAKLTPREAILNRNAAELLGRDTIKRLNDHGNMLSKRGVDLASLPSDPTPGPSTENMLGYQYGTPDVGRDDRADLLRDADTATYGGVPAPTPTPTPPTRGYQYGTSSVQDELDKRNRMFPFNKKGNAASRLNRPGIMNVQADPTKSDFNPISASQYIGPKGVGLGPQYDQFSGRVNPLPVGAIGVQGAQTPPASTSSFASTNPMSHTEMAADIARRNLTSVGSQLGTPTQQQTQIPSNNQGYLSPEDAAANNMYWSGGQTGWQIYGGNGADRNFSNVNTPSQNTVHFLPPGFTATTGSTGTPNSSQNDIHFLPPGFTAIQGQTNPVTKQLQQPKEEDQGYGSAYGY